MAMWSILALGASETIINQLLDLDPISRIKLNALSGQSLRIVIDAPNLAVDVYFDLNKLRLEATAMGQATQASIFEQRPYDPQIASHAATATLHTKTLIELAQLLLIKDDSVGNIPLQGDYQLLYTLKNILAELDVDLSAQLGPWIGASAAHEIGKLQQLPKQLLKLAKSAEFMLIDGLKEDSHLLAQRWQMDDLQQHTRQLQQEIDRLEARLQRHSSIHSHSPQD